MNYSILLSSLNSIIALTVIMDYSIVLNNVPDRAREWVANLQPHELAHLLTSFYDIETAKVTEPDSNSDSNSDTDDEPELILPEEPEPEQYAANIGKYGEQSFELVTKTLPVNYRVLNTAKAGHAGDFLIEYSVDGRVYRCLVDIKTYKSTVSQKEIDKFVADMTYGNYDAGLLVSRKSNFVGHPESVCIEDVTLPYARVPVMYLAKIDDELLNSCIEVICAKMSTIAHVQMDQASIMNSVNFINTSLSQSASTRRLLSEMQTTMTSQIQRCQENLIGCEVQIKMALKNMKREIERPHIVLPNAPSMSSRDDNIQDSPGSITPDIPVLEEEEVVRDEPPELTDFDFRKFCGKDRPLVQQLADMPWSGISQDEKGIDATFESTFVNLDIKPLKTKTRVEIFDSDNVGMEVPEDLTSQLVRKSNKYIGSLTQELIDTLHQYFSDS